MDIPSALVRETGCLSSAPHDGPRRTLDLSPRGPGTSFSPSSSSATFDAHHGVANVSELTYHAESSDDTIDLTVESDDVADEEGPPSDDAAEVPPGQTMAPHLGQKAALPPGIRASGRFFHGAAEISDFEMVIKIGEIEKIRREEDQAAEEADDLQQGTVAPHIPPNDVPTRVLPNPEIFRGLAHFQQTVSSIELRAVTIEKTMHLKRKLLRDFPTMGEGGEDDNRAKRIEVDASGRAPILGVDLIGRKSRSLKDINEDPQYNNLTMFEENDDVTDDEAEEEVDMTVDEAEEEADMTVDEIEEDVNTTDDDDFYLAVNPTPPLEAELAEAEASSALANLRHYDTSDASDGLLMLVDALEANLSKRPPEFDELLTETTSSTPLTRALTGCPMAIGSGLCLPSDTLRRERSSQFILGRSAVLRMMLKGHTCSRSKD